MLDNARTACKINQLAARQSGHVTREQLLVVGVSSRAIGYRLQSGAYVQTFRGVYALGYRRRSPREHAHAAVLACGERAVLSHDSAAALYGLRSWPRVPEVTCPTAHRRPGIRIHRSRTLTRAQITSQYGIRVTTAARAIADIAHRLTDAQLIHAVGDARRAGHLGPTELERLTGSSVRIARLIDPGQAPSDSMFMATFLVFVARHRLPAPLIEQRFHGFRVDAMYPSQRLIVELDSYEFHRDRDRFENDRRRDAVALGHGYVTFRITWERLTQEPVTLAAQLRAILTARAPDAARVPSQVQT